MEHMNLKALENFNRVVRHGGFGKAAEATGLPKATLSRHVRELEHNLGVRLLERKGPRLKVTEEGQALYERTHPLLTEIEEAARTIATDQDQPRGHLRISAPILFSQTVLGHLAARFAVDNPEVNVEITAEDRRVNMIEEGHDLVIRVNPDRDSTLNGRCFLRDRRVVVAAPSRQPPGHGQTVPAVVLGTPEASRSWTLRGAEARFTLHPEPVLRLASLFMVQDAVRTGVGAARLPLSMVSRDLARGDLSLWGEMDEPDVELWALYPSRRLLSRRVSAFLEYLRQAFPNASSEDLARFMDSH